MSAGGSLKAAISGFVKILPQQVSLAALEMRGSFLLLLVVAVIILIGSHCPLAIASGPSKPNFLGKSKHPIYNGIPKFHSNLVDSRLSAGSRLVELLLRVFRLLGPERESEMLPPDQRFDRSLRRPLRELNRRTRSSDKFLGSLPPSYLRNLETLRNSFQCDRILRSRDKNPGHLSVRRPGDRYRNASVS